MWRTLSWLAVLLSFSAGCGESDATPDGAAPPNPMTCGTMTPMQIGRCALDAGGDCRGALGETFSLVALSAGDDMRMVVGPQGSTMLVFLVRASGIDPGVPDGDLDPSQPLIEVTLFDATAGTQLSVYRQRNGFTMDASGYTSHQLWVVVDALASELNGRTITAIATLSDRNGEKRCAIIDVVPRS